MGTGRGSPCSPSFLPQKVKTCTYKSCKQKFIPQTIESVMSLQLGETLPGFKIQRPVQWVLRTQLEPSAF